MELGIDPLVILKLNLPKKLGIGAGILVLILALYGYIFYGDSQTMIDGLEGELTKQREEIEKKEALLKKKPKLEKELVELYIKEAEASKVLPQEKQIPELLSMVSSRTSIQGLKNKLFQPRPEAPSGIYATIPIDLEVQGTYHQFGYFLNDLSKLYRIVRVSEYKISLAGEATKQSGPAEAGSLNVVAKASTYRFINKAPELPTHLKKKVKGGQDSKPAKGQQGGAK
ncbi:MAG: type 4a pilus biogenesis protein PilO [Magnetococcales bacterium]|nr:type 4a pilus biogenesis protein PilO [Magnetococcales bacterium]NGZ25880.1 type 4a pilus biogenesis protein PilO [Magnetococcales bacterium]